MSKKIKELQERDKFDIPLLIKDAKNGTASNNKPYVSLVLADSTGMVDGKYWDVKPDQQDLIQIGKILKVNFEVIKYNGNLQLKVFKVEEADETSYDIKDFVVTSNESEDVRKEKLEHFLNSISNQTYKALVFGMLEKVGDKFMEYPAASKIHHSYVGGLSEHSLSMAELCEVVCEHYPQLNHDLLISGALIHDLGKTCEMSGSITTEYTLEGKLEGHISIANGWLTEVSEKLNLQDKEETILLHHMILAHHGHYEFGSPVLPQLQEAEVLCLIDNLDARMNTLKTALDGVKAGAWTSKLFALDNRQFYKPKDEEE